MIDLSNWAGNHKYVASAVHKPTSTAEVQELVARHERVKALGTRHCFNDIADTTGHLISTERLDKIGQPDAQTMTVSVGAGVRYGELCRFLHERGYAIHNLASLPHISVAGACATATHGSGNANGNLATAVCGMEVVYPDATIHQLLRGRNGDLFRMSVVHLGALGVVTKLTLETRPTFQMRQQVFEKLPFDAAIAHFDEISSAAYSVSLFTDWRGETINQVWCKQLLDEPLRADLTALGARAAVAKVHPLPDMPAMNCTEQLGVPGPWHERLPHFRMEFTPSSGEELQSEFFVPREHAADALRAVDGLRDRIAAVLHISEIRTIAADNLWLSPCYERDSVRIHFSWKKDWPRVRELLPLIEQALQPFDARPHWGKLFTMPPQRVAALYPRMRNFAKIARELDPTGKFRNRFLDALLND